MEPTTSKEIGDVLEKFDMLENQSEFGRKKTQLNLYLEDPKLDRKPIDVASIDSPCKGWLVKFIKTVDGKVRVLNPLTGRLTKDLLDHMPKAMLGKFCFLINNCNKRSKRNRFSLIAIDRYGLLHYLKSRDEK
ncbi:hypothetical protein BC332_02744 [Capsicum chinense]|nr:hypothetical protein BC332_02744 [Capsicum chinense]